METQKRFGKSVNSIILLFQHLQRGDRCAIYCKDTKKYKKDFKDITGHEITVKGYNGFYMVAINKQERKNII